MAEQTAAPPAASAKSPPPLIEAGKSYSFHHNDWSRLTYVLLCLPLIALSVYIDADAVRLECSRPKRPGRSHECQFVSHLNDAGEWSYFSLFSKPNVTDEFDLVDLLTCDIIRPDAKKKQGKGQFGSARSDAERPKKTTFGVELGLAQGNKAFWTSYPTADTAIYMSRQIESFIREADENTRKPVEGTFAQEATNIDEILLVTAVCMLMYFATLVPFKEALEVTCGFPSVMHLTQKTLVGSTHHEMYVDLDVLYELRREGAQMALKFKKTVYGLIGASSEEEAKREVATMTAHVEKCKAFAAASLKAERKKRRKAVDKKAAESAAAEKKAAEAAAPAPAPAPVPATGGGGMGKGKSNNTMKKRRSKKKESKAKARAAAAPKSPSGPMHANDNDIIPEVVPPELSFVQSTWDDAVSYLVPLVVAVPVTMHCVGYF